MDAIQVLQCVGRQEVAREVSERSPARLKATAGVGCRLVLLMFCVVGRDGEAVHLCAHVIKLSIWNEVCKANGRRGQRVGEPVANADVEARFLRPNLPAARAFEEKE